MAKVRDIGFNGFLLFGFGDQDGELGGSQKRIVTDISWLFFNLNCYFGSAVSM